MNLSSNVQSALVRCAEQKKDRLIEITRQLIRMPSENCPPDGAEQECQLWIAKQLRHAGLEPDVYCLDEVAGLRDHLLFYDSRNYADRPNVGARRKGTGAGRSLLLSGHIDTVPRGTQDWTRNPFGAQIEGNRLFGRGANDMKAGVATNLFVMECLAELGLKLQGDLLFESVIDEEFGGCNGTLAGRLRGHNADAAILSEPSALRICPAQRGGRTAHITFHAVGGVLQNGHFPTGVIPQITHFLAQVPRFGEQRRITAPAHPMYAGKADPVPVSITKVHTSPWGFQEPITTPEKAQIEMYWQLMPGESQADVEREFLNWIREVTRQALDIFPTEPEILFPMRWLPGSSIDESAPVVTELAECAREVLQRSPLIAGIEGPCDLFIFQQAFGIPAAIWGATGGNTHAADEYVEIDSLVTAAKTLLLFTANWCGVGSGDL